MYFPTAEIEVSPLVPPLVAFVVSFFTSMGGISGAFLLLPFQMTFLGYPNTSVSATNPLYNVFANPGGVFRYFREKPMLWPLSWIVMAGAVPGVVIRGILRINWVAEVRPFQLFLALVLLRIRLEMIRDLLRRMRLKAGPKKKNTPPKPHVEVLGRNLAPGFTTFGRVSLFPSRGGPSAFNPLDARLALGNLQLWVEEGLSYTLSICVPIRAILSGAGGISGGALWQWPLRCSFLS